MSHRFGLLDIPVPAPQVEDDEIVSAVSDPLLDVLLAFMKAVLNADTGTAWAAVAPADPLPVAFTFTHDPDLESFSDNNTPALYIWRDADKGSKRYSQDLIADEAPISVLWVPPPASQEDRRVRRPFRNAIKKCLKAAFGKGRHPAWVVEDDDYFEPEEYGSVLLKHAKAASLKLGEFRPHELVIESLDGGKTIFDCLFFTILPLEFYVEDPLVSGVAVTEGRATMSLRPSEEVDPLQIVDARFVMSVDTPVDPDTGSTDGGDVVTITGAQFAEEDMVVLFDETEGTLVTFVDESTLQVTSPAHDAGTVNITVRHPSGQEVVLTAAFTYA